MVNTVVREVKEVHKWTISNFCVNCNSVGDAWYSPQFSTISDGNKYDWRLILYPKGYKEENKDYISMFLQNCNKADVIVNASVGILHNIDNAITVIYSVRIKDSEIKVGKVSGYPNYLKRDSPIMKPDIFLNKGPLTIMCEITSSAYSKTTDAVKAKLESRHSQQLQTLSLDLEQLINQKDHSDVSINIGGKTMHAHKSILGKRSSVFAAMFQHNTKEKKLKKVEITDIKREVFEEMLRYMYCGKVNNIELIAVDLLAAADKYSLDGLVKMCEDSLTNTLSVAGIFESLKLADRFNVKDLRARAIEFIASHADEVVSQAEFKQLPYDVISEVCCVMAKCKK